MFRELEPDRFKSLRPLLDATMSHNLSPVAVLDGVCPGRAWADDPDSPGTALIDAPEGHFLAGKRPAGEVADALRELIVDAIYARARSEKWQYLCLHYPEPDWREAVAGLLGDPYAVWDYQQHFVLERPRLYWREGMPGEFAMRRVDATLLSDNSLANVNRLRGWAASCFGSLEGFLANGFGFCTVCGREIASWCMADCVSGDRAEIGIHTAEQYRRRGLASRTAAAAVEHCLSRRITHIGWHCWSTNQASAATARAVGFVKTLDHHAVHVWFDERDGLIADGNLHLLRGEYADAAQRYERALAGLSATNRSESRALANVHEFARYCYKAACTCALSGRRDAAIEHIKAGLETELGY